MMQASAYGRLTSDPTLRESQAGKPRASARLAVDAGTTHDDEPQTLFLGIVAFGKLAERLTRHTKGDPVSVSGRIEMNQCKIRRERPGRNPILSPMRWSARRPCGRNGGKRKRYRRRLRRRPYRSMIGSLSKAIH